MSALPQLLGLGLSGATAAGDTIAQLMANAANEGRYQEALGLNASLGQFGHEILDRVGGRQNQGFQGLADFTTQTFRGNPADNNPGLIAALQGGYGDLRGRALANYEGYGRQGRRDINQQFDTLASQARGDATRRGLASSTVLGGLNRGIARERADALGRHDERVQMGRINLDTALTGNMLANQERMGLAGYQAEMAARMNQLAAQERGDMRTLDFGRENIGNRINLMASRNDVYQPTPLSAYQNLFAGLAPAPNFPTDNSGLTSGLFGLASAGTFGLAAGA